MNWEQKPWFVTILTWSLFLVPVTEGSLYFFTTRTENIHIPSRTVIVLWVLGLSCLVGAYGIWKVRLWGYILFVSLMVAILGGELYEILIAHSLLNFWEIFNVSLVAIVLASILHQYVRTPYINPRVRWWERSPRHEITIPLLIEFQERSISAELLDLSISGCFLYPTENLVPGTMVSIKIDFNGLEFQTLAKVITHLKDPNGFGLMFAKTNFKNRKTIKEILRNLRLRVKSATE